MPDYTYLLIALVALAFAGPPVAMTVAYGLYLLISGTGKEDCER